MKKLTHFASALANNTLSMRAMTQVKGGTDPNNGNGNGNGPQTPEQIAAAVEDEKRRERPGGGMSTN
jgi:hypothetical protein